MTLGTAADDKISRSQFTPYMYDSYGTLAVLSVQIAQKPTSIFHYDIAR